MAVTVYRFGLPAWVAMPPVVDEQLHLAHRLRGDLVELEREHDRQRAAVWSSYPDVEAAEKERDAAEAEVERLAEIVADERKRQRTRAPKHPAVAELRESKARLREARQARRDAIATVREQASARLAKLTERLRLAQKELYGRYGDEGLYWAARNDVIKHHKTAARRIRAVRAQGRPAQLRHHRWDGSGTLAVQLQRQADDPPRTPGLLASGGGKWRNVLQIAPGRAVERPRQVDHPAHGTLRMHIGDGLVTLPVVLDCDMDPAADVAEARLVLRRVAGQRRCHLTVTAKLPDAEPVADGMTVAVHCGWRREPDDAVRAATWRADQPVTVPDRLTDVVRTETDRTGTVVMPAASRDRIAHYDTVQAGRDRELETLRAELVGWLEEHPQPDGPAVADIRRWRAEGRFARLAWQWHHATPDGAEQITARLMSWRRWDKALWEERKHGRRKALGRRDDAWRRVAAWLASIASTVVVDDTDLAGLVRQVTMEETPLPTEVTQVAARQRVDAAPGYLRERVKAAAVRDGVRVVTVPAKGLSAQCHRCGYDRNDPAAHQIVCTGCGRRYDRDTSATAHMLDRASAPVESR